jgi:hypothetical protein
MAILFALVVVGLGHGTVLMESFPCNEPQFIVNLVYAVGLGAVISLVVFAGPGMVYRRKLDQWREKCRQMAARLLESRLGKPATAPLRDNRVGEEDARHIVR